MFETGDDKRFHFILDSTQVLFHYKSHNLFMVISIHEPLALGQCIWGSMVSAAWYLVLLRVQNELFSEEKGFILHYTEKEV